MNEEYTIVDGQLQISGVVAVVDPAQLAQDILVYTSQIADIQAKLTLAQARLDAYNNLIPPIE